MIRSLNIEELLGNQDRYIIPIYQRKYAWGAKEIEQLIQDVVDYCADASQNCYYLGTMIVAGNAHPANVFEVVDGQQRLTTLTILALALRNKYITDDVIWLEGVNLIYAGRPLSANSLQEIFNDNFAGNEHDADLRSAYSICIRELSIKTAEKNISILDFSRFLFKNARILRVPLPAETDLNHYFEIMNSRGQQLEKHEILKAKLMEFFATLDHLQQKRHEQAFHLVWESCQNMERYVQYGFTADERNLVFDKTEWDSLAVHNFDELVNVLGNPSARKDESVGMTIDEIINAAPVSSRENKEDPDDRFAAVISFPNFLLHVLRVQTGSSEIALDDKRLIDIFMLALSKEEDKIGFVKAFAFNLLKCKFLFDKYIIKRELISGRDRWILKSLKKSSTVHSDRKVSYVNTFGEEENDAKNAVNRRALMLLSMFHVSVPSMSYKYWLNAVLHFVFHTDRINAGTFISYLERLAQTFVFDRFLARRPNDYQEMITQSASAAHRTLEDLDLSKLRYGSIQNNLVFNYLDYLIWLREKEQGGDQKIGSFEFTSRSSVEHYYPQQPLGDGTKRLDKEYLHAFGNLCLISHEKNSRLNNYLPEAKKAHYSPDSPIDSLKQYLMMGYSGWAEPEIRAHEQDMLALLMQSLQANSKGVNSVSAPSGTGL